MAGPTAAVAEAWDTVTGFLRSQVNDQKNWDRNYTIAKAVGLFAGSILFMRNFGDLMAV